MSKTLSVHAILTALLTMAAFACVARAEDPSALLAGPGPDAARLRDIEAQLRNEGRARILGPFVDVEVSVPRAHEEGVTFEGVLRHDGGSVPQDDKVGWSEIEKLQVRRSSVGRGALIGTIVGVAIGLAAGLSMTRECEGWLDFFCGASATDVANITVGAAGVGLVTSAVVGAPLHHWKTVYDATE